MKAYSYRIHHLPLPLIAAIFAIFLSANTLYLLITVPSYTQYIDYWGLAIAGILFIIGDIFFAKKHPSLLLIPSALVAITACFSLGTLHWCEIALFFILMILCLIRIPFFLSVILKILSVIATGIGIWSLIDPCLDRIDHLAASGNATADYIIPYLFRSLGSGTAVLICMVLLIFALCAKKQDKTPQNAA